MNKIGLIGYRGMIGKVFLKRIIKKKFFSSFVFFGKKKNKRRKKFLEDDFSSIFKCKILVLCKDNIYVKKIYNESLKRKWNGYFIDSSSYFRNKKEATICLDPLNKKYIIKKIKKGRKIFCGGNCTVSLMMIALKNLFLKNIIDDLFCTTFQSMSGAGYLYSNKILSNFRSLFIKKKVKKFEDINKVILEGKNINSFTVIPWIGESNNKPDEEKKGDFETNIILKKINLNSVNVFSNCVRINSVRCHSQSLFIKLNKNISIKKFLKILKNKNSIIIKNSKYYTEKYLNPNYVSGKKKIFIGRIKKIKKKMFSLFTVGDQLIWGATEPLYLTLKHILNYVN